MIHAATTLDALTFIVDVITAGLQDLLGYHSSDLSGQTVSAVGADGGVEHHLKHCADRLKAWQYTREELDTTFHSFEVGARVLVPWAAGHFLCVRLAKQWRAI